MTTREIQLPIRGFGASPSSATLEVGTLSGRERIRRGATAVGIGVLIALMVLPIPIVHFAVPPMAILGGCVVGIRRLLQKEIITGARGVCPFCGAEQTLGLSGSSFHLPRDLKCRSCLKLLRIDKAA
jgi:hypothetical protein